MQEVYSITYAWESAAGYDNSYQIISYQDGGSGGVKQDLTIRFKLELFVK
ncbi:hypothetical protein IB642_03615 [Allofrancisella guangzhouensis]|nr:hypothetical protein [Allofrancisella guangzhouensis]MBK2026812.1 hypothetical protein [Allofrancisella guangzhouensis]MBK2044107.1 hypothetical protein [Allofrancisella guangzhouensis]MBK2046162.1 hypothetical protein [Allofrancisella guangzhouensis]